MIGRRSLLTAEVQTSLVAAIKSGAYDWVAAESAGIGRRTFYDWLARGERAARGEARCRAEEAVCQRDPLSWLRLGPGRERQDEPGWTSPQKPPALAAIQSELEQMLHRVLSSNPAPGRKRAVDSGATHGQTSV